MDINTLKTKIEYFSYMAKNWKDEDVVVIEKDVVLELLEQVKNNDLLHSVSDCDIDKLIDKLDQTSQEIEPCCVGLPNYKDDDSELKILRQVVRNWISCR